MTSEVSKTIPMVDLQAQHRRIENEINEAIQAVINSAAFISGPAVKQFAQALADYTQAGAVITCGNGTDALQITMMALEFKPGDEVIVPAFTYVATVEVIALLGLTPVFIDVDPDTFNLNASQLESLITERTKAIVPVHLYGQCASMQEIMQVAEQHKLHVIEDTAQALGADYLYQDGHRRKAGTIGTVGTTSFFPSKNLGCFGDGGAIFTNNEALGAYMQSISNHGQSKKYYHDEIGVNSRLDTLQAAILNVKLGHLDQYCKRRQEAADYYDAVLQDVTEVQIPARASYSTHVFHQYTLKVAQGKRDALRDYLKQQGIPSMIYYPLPLTHQKAYRHYAEGKSPLPVSEALCEQVLSLPMHPEMEEDQLQYITDHVKRFFHG